MSENPSSCNKNGTPRLVAKKHRRSARLGMTWCFLCAIAFGATLCVPSLATTPSPEYLRTLTGHTENVTSVAFSPNGATLASGSEDGSIKMWNVVTGLLVRSFTVDTGAVTAVAFSPDGTTLAAAAFGGMTYLWNTTTGATLGSHTGYASPISLAFSPDGALLVSGGAATETVGEWLGGTPVEMWDVAKGEPLPMLIGHTDWIWSVAFSPDGRLLASGSEDRIVRLWDVATRAMMRTIAGHSGPVRSVTFSPDGTMLASASGDKTLKLWNVATGRLVRAFIGHTDCVASAAFSPDGTLLASGSWDNTVKLWDVTTGALVRALVGHTDSVRSVTFSPDGATLASASADNTIKLWSVTLAPQPPCAYSISPMSVSVSHTGHSGTIRVTAQSGCSWAASSQSTWIDITSGPGGSGNGTVSYTVDANSATKLRIGMMTIAGTTFTVIQDAPPTRPPSPHSPLDVRWEARWECNEARGTCNVSVEVTIENTGYATSTGTVCWVGLHDIGNWYWSQEESWPTDIGPGERWTFTLVLVCPYNAWTRIDIRVRNETGAVLEEESRESFIP